MKKVLSIVSVILLLTTVSAKAQGILLFPQTEKTVAGYQYGAALLAENKKLWGIGAFYQAGINSQGEMQPKDPFYGVMISAPVMKTDKVSFFGTLRAGFVNEDYAVVVPGLETRLSVTNRIGASFGMGLRMGYPSVSGKLFIKIL